MAKLFHQSQSPGEDLARTTLLLTGITIISRLLGFGRDVLIAYTLGGGAQADVFVAVFRLPNFVRRMSSEGCISMPFIPEYFRRLRGGTADSKACPSQPSYQTDQASQTGQTGQPGQANQNTQNYQSGQSGQNGQNYHSEWHSGCHSGQSGQTSQTNQLNQSYYFRQPGQSGQPAQSHSLKKAERKHSSSSNYIIAANPASPTISASPAKLDKHANPSPYSPQGEEEAMLFARSAMLWVILLCAPLCALAMLFPEQAILLVAPGFALKAEEMDASATLLRLLVPYTLVLCTLAIGGSILQGRGRFISPVITPCIPNITVLAVMVMAIVLGDIHLYPQTAGQPAHAALLFCQALLFSSILQWLYMGSRMRKEKLGHKNLHWFGPVSLKSALPFIKKIPVSLCGTANHQVNILITGMGASVLAEGAVAQFHYADQLVSLPLGLFGIAIGIISLPILTDLAAEGKINQLRLTLAQGMRLGLFLSLPAAAGLAGIAQPLVQILFERGAFNANASQGTALALAGASLCLPALAVSRPLLAACHAKGYIHLAAVCGIISMLFTGLASLALPALFQQFQASQLSLLGIGLAVSFGAWIFTSLLWFALAKKQLTPNFGQLHSCLAPFCFCLVIFILCRLFINFLPNSPYLSISLLVPFCMISYFAFSKLFNCKEASIILNSLKK